MREAQDIEGRWWIFGEDKPPHYGILHFDPETGLTLDVKVPESYDISEMFKQSPPLPDPLKGRDKHDSPVTLFGVGCPGPAKSGGLATFRAYVLRAILGADFSSWSESKFCNATARYSLLHKWISRSGIRQDLTTQDALHFSHKAPPDIKMEIPRGVELLVSSDCALLFLNGVQLTEDHFVQFTFPQPLHVDEIFHDYLAVFGLLLTLFTGTPVFIDTVKGGLKDDDMHQAEILTTNNGVNDAKRDLSPHEMRVQYAEIHQRFPEILKRWFECHNRLKSAMGLYFATIFNKHLYGTHVFLLLAQAFEVYHNDSEHFTSAVQSTADFRDRVEMILQSVNEGERPWVKEKLHHANQKTLAQRLREIFDRDCVEVSKLISDPESFAVKVRNMRNYYTHYDDELIRKGKIPGFPELSRMIMQMRALLEICFLRDLGISGEPINRVIQRYAGATFTTLD